jgi:hypothetical protein
MGGPMHPAAVHVLASRKRKFLDQVKATISSKIFLLNHLDQACTIYAPQDKFGPTKPLIWPAKPNIFFTCG